MSRLSLVALAVMFGFSGAAFAQTSAPARDPVRGDAVPNAAPAPTGSRAEQNAKADKQGPGTENGNQPDRAAAGGGSR